MIILFSFVFLIILVLFILEKDKINILKRLSLTFIISGSFIIVLGIIFNIIMKKSITYINIGNGINIVVYKFIIMGIIFYVCSLISYLGYYLIKKVYMSRIA